MESLRWYDLHFALQPIQAIDDVSKTVVSVANYDL